MWPLALEFYSHSGVWQMRLKWVRKGLGNTSCEQKHMSQEHSRLHCLEEWKIGDNSYIYHQRTGEKMGVDILWIFLQLVKAWWVRASCTNLTETLTCFWMSKASVKLGRPGLLLTQKCMLTVYECQSLFGPCPCVCVCAEMRWAVRRFAWGVENVTLHTLHVYVAWLFI